ncbi:MAG: DEAD/DEAH box helicase [Thermoanaerobaculia bacterium]
MPPIAPLADRIPPRETTDADEILGLFLDWVSATGMTLYPAQEEALLEIMAGKHVILATPTGSGKSLVALGLHFKAVCEGRVSFYTSPIKALASEKFFSLCGEFGPENVGMLTGDASINAEAGVVCCTAEVLSNMALRLGEDLVAPYVVMDEFHFYGDRERGVAWQVPLLVLPRTQFLLMSATLGDTSAIAERLTAFTGREVAYVSSEDRPVPLDYEYRETPLHETIEDLLAQKKSPVYVVNFTQRECAELAQSLTSVKIGSKDEREEIRKVVGERRLTTPYGKEFRRFLSFGIGVHHAGLLPKYRLLVEQLAQKGLLHVICGTDTLGVGVNIPIRTVLFTKLAKFDGTKVGLLSVREFKQISGRAGRRGFDDRGSVVGQAPDHIVDKRQAEKKADASGKKTSRTFKGPAKGEVSWTIETFQKLISRPPETLKSRFRLTHGMVLDLLQRDEMVGGGSPGFRNFWSLRDLIARCHEEDAAKARLMKDAALLVRSLYRAGIIGLAPERPYRVAVAADLQWDFSLHQALSLFALSVLAELDPLSATYAVDAISVVESILEDPDVILRRQVDRAKGKLIAELKAEGIPYQERMERLEEVTHPKPLADFLYGAFNEFRVAHPWTAGSDVSPKSIGREMFETFSGFADYVKSYGLERSEGVLLRYLSQLYKTLDQTIPEGAKTDELWDALGYFRSLVGETDASLLEEWESLRHPELLLREARQPEARKEAAWLTELLSNPKVFAARVRAEMHLLVRALAARDWEEAAERVYQRPDTDEATKAAGIRWDAERFESAMAPFFEEYSDLVSGAEARLHHWTNLRPAGPRRWEVTQTLLDPKGDHTWAVFAHIDLRDGAAPDGPILRIERIGT